MPVCALCEHVQPAGDACEVCGRAFPLAQRTPLPIAPVEGFEPTSFVAAVTAAPERLPDLEPTAVGAAGLPAPEGPLLELEPTRAAPVNVAVVRLEGVEHHAPEPIPGAKEPPARVCRYCRTPAHGAEALCGRCGMRLARVPAPAGSPRPARVQVCTDCGAPMTGTQCMACGARKGSLS